MKEDINLVKRENSYFFKEIYRKEEINLNDECDGYLVQPNEKEIRRIISFLKEKNIKKFLAIMSLDDLTNKRFVETLNFDFLVSPENSLTKDSLKQKSSGLNLYLAKLCKKKKIKILISIDNLIKRDKRDKARIISRIIQNIKICRKADCDIKIASFSKNFFLEKKERERIGFSWGMSSQQVAKCSLFDEI
ncbi:MAG: hypothetical protein QW273_02675 [Candidatus Pacearchaeota archaeon]